MNSATLLAIGCGGFIGAILRSYCVFFINSSFNSSFPYGTVFVNLLGSLILGALIAYLDNSLTKSFLTTGMLGAFTTFSTFAVESVLLMHRSDMLFLYITISVVGSILLAYLSYKSVSFFI